MDPAQLAHEALKRFLALHARGTNGILIATRDLRDGREPGNDALLEVFAQLGKIDGWAKVSMDRLAGDPLDARATRELRGSLEQTARLHPHFNRRLADALVSRPAVKTSLSSSVKSAPQPAVVAGRTA